MMKFTLLIAAYNGHYDVVKCLVENRTYNTKQN